MFWGSDWLAWLAREGGREVGRYSDSSYTYLKSVMFFFFRKFFWNGDDMNKHNTGRDLMKFV